MVRLMLMLMLMLIIHIQIPQYFIYVELFTKRLFPTAAAFAAKPLRAKLGDFAGQRVVCMQV